MRVKTDYMKVRSIETFIKALDDASATLRKEADAGDLYSGLQADVIDPISAKLKEILGGTYGQAPQGTRRTKAKG